jgi:hypothetical protein
MTEIGIALIAALAQLVGTTEQPKVYTDRLLPDPVPVVVTCREDPAPYGGRFLAWQDVNGNPIDWCKSI